MKRESQTVFCPYCGEPAILREASNIYKTHTLEEYLYACNDHPVYDAYASVHGGTLFPKESLVNKELRRKRIVVHRYFNLIQKHGVLNRKNAYFWLQDIFGLTSDQTYIGQFSDYMYDQATSTSKRVLENNRIAC